MISFLDAIETIKQHTINLGKETVYIQNSVGRISQESIICKYPIPSFQNSAMDGFAVNVRAISNLDTTFIPVSTEMAAGDSCIQTLSSATACEVMTGAIVPNCFDTVMPIEQTNIIQELNGKPKVIEFKNSLETGNNIRLIGEDFQIGDKILTHGETISAEHVAALAAQGIGTVKVSKKPTASIITTGSELLTAGLDKISNGKIFDTNGPYLQAQLTKLGLEYSSHNCVSDNIEKLILLLRQANSDLIITTGGVSVGRYDYIPTILKKLHAEIIFHGVAQRPGKPLLFAKFPNGKLLIGLPGNPAAVIAGFRFYIYPWIIHTQGANTDRPVKAILTEDTKTLPRLDFLKKAYVYFKDNKLVCDVLAGQESFKIKPMLNSNCWAHFPAGNTKCSAGTIIDIYYKNTL